MKIKLEALVHTLYSMKWNKLGMSCGWGWLQRICGVLAEDMWWVAGLTETKAKPSSWDLAELGNKLSRVGVVAEDMWCGCRWYVMWLQRICGGWLD
jgi:hypothetical protein